MSRFGLGCLCSRNCMHSYECSQRVSSLNINWHSGACLSSPSTHYKSIWASGRSFLLILNPISRRSCKLHASAALPRCAGHRTPAPIEWEGGRVGGFESWSGHFGEKVNLQPLPAIEPRFLGCPTRNLVTNPAKTYPMTRGKIPWHAAFNAVQNLFIYFARPASPYWE